MAFKASLMSSITCQMAPPLKVAGSWVRSCQISLSFSSQVPRAEFRLSTIQFVRLPPYGVPPVIRSRISLAKVTTSTPARVRKPWDRWDG